MIRRRRARETRPAPRPRTDAKTQVEHMKVVARMPTELSVEETAAPADSQVGDV